MADCELLSWCPYFNDKTYGMTESFKERYCKGDHAWCGRYMAFKSLERESERNVPEREGLFRESGNNKGLTCPFKSIICEVGCCKTCQIYLDWQKLGEIIVICAWCSKVIDRKPGLGQTGVSHGICPECKQKYFPKAGESVQ